MASFFTILAVFVIALTFPFVLPLPFAAVTSNREILSLSTVAMASVAQALTDAYAATTAAAEFVTSDVMDDVATIYSVVAALFSASAAVICFVVAVPSLLVAYVRSATDEDSGPFDRFFVRFLVCLNALPFVIAVISWLSNLVTYVLVERPAKLRALVEQEEAYRRMLPRVDRLFKIHWSTVELYEEANTKIKNLRVQSRKAHEEWLDLFQTAPKFEINVRPVLARGCGPKFASVLEDKKLSHFLARVQKLELAPAIALLETAISELEAAIAHNKAIEVLLNQAIEDRTKTLNDIEKEVKDRRALNLMHVIADEFEEDTARGWRLKRFTPVEELLATPPVRRPVRSSVFAPRYRLPSPPVVATPPAPEVVAVEEDRPTAAVEVAVLPVANEPSTAVAIALVPEIVVTAAEDRPAAADETIAAPSVVIVESPAPVAPVLVPVVVPDLVNAHQPGEQREQALPQPVEQNQGPFNWVQQQQQHSQDYHSQRQIDPAFEARQAQQLEDARNLSALRFFTEEDQLLRKAAIRAQREETAAKSKLAAEAQARRDEEAKRIEEAAAIANAEVERKAAELRWAQAQEAARIREAEDQRVKAEALYASQNRACAIFVEAIRIKEAKRVEAERSARAEEETRRLEEETRRLEEEERLRLEAESQPAPAAESNISAGFNFAWYADVFAEAKRKDEETGRQLKAKQKEDLEKSRVDAKAYFIAKLPEADEEQQRLQALYDEEDENNRKFGAWIEQENERKALAGFEAKSAAELEVKLNNQVPPRSAQTDPTTTDRDQLVEQHIEFNKIQANLIALRAEADAAMDDSDMSSDTDDDAPPSPDAMLPDAPDVDMADARADAAHEAALDAFALEEENRWFNEDHATGAANANNVNTNAKRAYLESDSEDSDSDESETGVVWEDVVHRATTAPAAPCTPAGRRILPAKAVNSRVVQSQLNYELDRNAGLIAKLSRGLGRPTPPRENIGQSPRLSDEEALQLTEVRVGISPAAVSQTPEQAKEAIRHAEALKKQAVSDRMREQAQLDKQRRADATAARVAAVRARHAARLAAQE